MDFPYLSRTVSEIEINSKGPNKCQIAKFLLFFYFNIQFKFDI